MMKTHGPAGEDRLQLIKDSFKSIIKNLSCPFSAYGRVWNADKQLASR